MLLYCEYLIPYGVRRNAISLFFSSNVIDSVN